MLRSIRCIFVLIYHVKNYTILEKNVIDVWDEELAKYGSKIIVQREEFVRKIDNISNKIHQEITNGKEFLSLTLDGITDTFGITSLMIHSFTEQLLIRS